MTFILYVAFWFCAISAIVHLLWAGVVAPVARVRMRFKLFAIRDKVRFEKLKARREGKSLDNFNELEQFVNNGIYLIDHFGFFDFLRINVAGKRSPSSTRPIASDCKELAREVVDVVFVAAAINSIMTFFYLLPLVYFLKAAESTLTHLLAKPERELAGHFPRSYA